MSEPNQPVLQFMKMRRSVPAKTMTGPGPGLEDIRSMVEIASRVPDHGKIAPWRFVLYSQAACERINKEVAKRAAGLYPGQNEEMRQIEASRFSRTPVVIAVISAPKQHPKVPAWEQELSAGAAAMNLLIAANAHGYDAQWLTEWVAFDEALGPVLGLKEGERLAGFIHIGTRTAPKTERDRPVFDSIFSIMEE